MYSIQCLGVGRGATNFLTGEPSTAYVLKQNGIGYLLLDMGAGVGRSALSHLGTQLPNTLYVSHNHSDHTGDLPVFLATKRGQNVTIIGHENVLSTVREHRLHEMPSVGVDPEKDVTWIEGDEGAPILFEDLEFQMFRSQHGYECYGFVLSYRGDPILGWTADSRFNDEIYRIISQAPIAIVHGRDRPSGDHAALDEIDGFAANTPATQFYVAHYGASEFAFTSPNASLLKVGQTIDL